VSRKVKYLVPFGKAFRIPGSGLSYTQSIGNSEPQPIELNARAARVMRRAFEIATEGEPQELRDAIACFPSRNTKDSGHRDVGKRPHS